MARIYTRTGDEGETTLMGGKRASKAHPRVEAMGDVDELNASIGVAMAAQSDPKVLDFLGMVQNTLFTVGAELSVAAGAKAEMPHVTSHDVMMLEAAMDAMDPGKITEFVMPRGSMAVSTLHLARAVARRAERHLFALSAKEPVNPELLRYLNRLSSLLFTLAVWVQRNEGTRQEHPTYQR
ncbi:MAG TPA: cob(I)yrinic acid a,c-diamide adenosyltransferase [Thermoplasmata archaeon]|nr:cob(I)yrinic acid a,c-diamide adenosyltransferase [Thermoplasmata archaeon]